MRKVSAPNILLLSTSLARGVPQVPGHGHDDDDGFAHDDGHADGDGDGHDDDDGDAHDDDGGHDYDDVHDDDDGYAHDDGHGDGDGDCTTFTTQTFTPPDIHHTVCKRKSSPHHLYKRMLTRHSPRNRLSPHRTSRRGVNVCYIDMISKTCFKPSISLAHSSTMSSTDCSLFTVKY